MSMSSSPQSTIVNAPPISQNLTTLGLGYAIAVSFAFLLLLSTILLASYICCRSSLHLHATATSSSSSPPDAVGNSVIVPRFFFVAADNDDDEESGVNIVVGLDHAVINSYPKFPFSKSGNSDADDPNSNSSCAICLCEYREAEMLRMMPDCKHYFHLRCLDAWLRLNGSCPVCRNSPLPTPVSTPLAEVVPLARYAADRTRTTRSSSSD